MLIKSLVVILTLMSIGSASATVIYKWVDKDGVTHYSQQIPEDAASDKLYSEDIEQQPIGFIAPKERPAEPEPSEEEKNAARIKKENKQHAADICENAKHSLKFLTTHSRLRSKDETTGEMVAMREEDRQARIKEQEERIRLFCK
ncbi:DUF4124 domain-containing protein [uncultured Shewanella sp.]|uniref:DUF4124 domain-containing protein n=1 Tax=Shewanella atlantica TaxID=271099 RepID=UPI00262D0D0A|nr:DUF4124 domain-containing protein [uncultured Shewanella sp.]